MECATMRIASKASEDNPAGFVVINTVDFDPETMQEFEAKAADPDAEAAAKLASEAAAKLASEAAAKTASGGVVPPWGK